MVSTMPPLLSSGLRFSVAGGALAAWVLLRRGRSALHMSWRQLAGAAVVGVLLMLGGNGLVSVGENAGVPSGLAALLIASEPMWVIVLRLAFRDRVPKGTLIGVLVGFGGVAVLLLPGTPSGATAIGVATVLFAAAMWATGSFSMTKVPTPTDPLASTATQMLCGGVAMFAVGLIAGEAGDVHPDKFSTGSIVGLVYLIIVGSLVAFSAYTWLLRNVPTQSGVSLPKFYAWVQVFSEQSLLFEGAGRDVRRARVEVQARRLRGGFRRSARDRRLRAVHLRRRGRARAPHGRAGGCDLRRGELLAGQVPRELPLP